MAKKNRIAKSKARNAYELLQEGQQAAVESEGRMCLPVVLPVIGLDGITLSSGGHATREAAVCAMEAVSWLAGEPHSAEPACACPVIGAFMIDWNDGLPTNAERDRLLKPLLVALVGSKSTPAVEVTRSWLAFDWLVRVHGPAWMDLTPALKPHADALRALPEITDRASLETGAAARAAARAAAGEAALAAVRPTVEQLQTSAADLVRRMVAITESAS